MAVGGIDQCARATGHLVPGPNWGSAMSKFSISFAVIILASALSAPAYAHGKGGGGGGGGHHAGGGGGGHHAGGGGGHYHFIGGGGALRHLGGGCGSSRWSGRSRSRGARLAARSLSTRSAGALHRPSARLATAGW